ncbi:group I truncated hemoglobin [Sphingomonas lenta]|uniref:Group 1 truncated hemoglobin n=1 Tax=Sphingomonas lenta TaxID=1141887 RepID=A0A2A2SI00_9SPHN|nr:group 1 truncated hemoglobin [Sphingomonas lenta]PAX08651.1 group 1 truncated hemoglobin [Sphingomonas lenta]
MLLIALALLQTTPVAVAAAEEPIAPYAQSNANAGAKPFESDGMWRAFHGREGVDRIVDGLVERSLVDPRISDTFKGHDMVRLRRVLKEQFCHLLGGGCAYSGRTMKDSHKDMGLQTADMGALVENLQAEMNEEGVPFFAQNRLLAKLAPMKRDVVER